MKYRIYSLLLACLLGLTSFVACQRMHEEEVPQGLTIHLSQEIFTKREVRAPSDQSVIKTLDVIFIDNSGNVQAIAPNNTGSTSKRVFRYVIDPLDPSVKWKNNNRSTNTIVLTEVQHQVFSNVKMFVLANLSQTVHDNIANGTLDTQNKIKDAVSVSLAANTAHALTEPFLLTGETASFSWDGNVDKEVPVELKRAVAAIDVVIHYDWDKLDPANHEGKYTLKEFDSKTYVGEHYSVDAPVNSTEQTIPRTTNNPPTSTITFFLNEYDLTKTGTTGLPPYILLKLKKLNGAKELPGGKLPPPAGDEKDVNGTDTYYRIVLPPTIQRNYYYTLHAHISQPGSDTEEGATTLQFNFSVLPWVYKRSIPQ